MSRLVPVFTTALAAAHPYVACCSCDHCCAITLEREVPGAVVTVMDRLDLPGRAWRVDLNGQVRFFRIGGSGPREIRPGTDPSALFEALDNPGKYHGQ